MSKNLPKYPEGTEECIHCLGNGRYNNGILIQNCPQCGGKGYRNSPKKHAAKEPANDKGMKKNNVLKILRYSTIEKLMSNMWNVPIGILNECIHKGYDGDRNEYSVS